MTLFALCCLCFPGTTAGDVLRTENLVAWCVVPFDARQRTPQERVAMLKRLGFSRMAYDWRDAHLSSFETEVVELKKAGITLQAVWFPESLNKDAHFILDVLKRHQIQTDFWISPTEPSDPSDQQKVQSVAQKLKPLLAAAASQGCTVSLYHHGGWLGRLENQLAIIKACGSPQLGVIYNFHHAHDQIDRLADILRQLQSSLRCLTISGMVKQGDRIGKKIMPLGAGDEDLALLRIIVRSGYQGPIAILGHEHAADVEDRLRDNLEGLQWLKKRLQGQADAASPTWRSYPVKK